MPPVTSNIFDHVRANKRTTVWIFILFIGLFSALGLILGVVWGSVWLGLVVSLLAAGLYALIVLPSAGDMVLSMTKAKQVAKKDYPVLYNVTEGIAVAAGIPMPKLYVIEDDARNAFATGTKPENGVIVVTTGLLAALDRRELEGVIAHEMAHIRNRDIMVMLYAAVLVGAIMLLSDFLLRSFLWGGKGGDGERDGRVMLVAIVVGLVLAILAPIIAELIRLAVSRRREYLADADAVVLTRNPSGLRKALEKIAADPDPLVDTANKATAHLFISTPFRTRRDDGTKKTGLWQRLFSTHPPIEERIELLKRMGG